MFGFPINNYLLSVSDRVLKHDHIFSVRKGKEKRAFLKITYFSLAFSKWCMNRIERKYIEQKISSYLFKCILQNYESKFLYLQYYTYFYLIAIVSYWFIVPECVSCITNSNMASGIIRIHSNSNQVCSIPFWEWHESICSKPTL